MTEDSKNKKSSTRGFCPGTKRDPKRGKTVEAVDVLSPQPKMTYETFPPKGKFQIQMGRTSAHIPAESGMNHGKNQGSEVLDFNEAVGFFRSNTD
ncbi:hypothetical protein V6N12_028319 [Hibiscus sabdariffa]|uniref:Uncharacterized protein n=1 Tax=Hibiscus sabdariffa TaxID=183260 RepID=A0ABR2F5I2_9ROSI